MRTPRNARDEGLLADVERLFDRILTYVMIKPLMAVCDWVEKVSYNPNPVWDIKSLKPLPTPDRSTYSVPDYDKKYERKVDQIEKWLDSHIEWNFIPLFNLPFSKINHMFEDRTLMLPIPPVGSSIRLLAPLVFWSIPILIAVF